MSVVKIRDPDQVKQTNQRANRGQEIEERPEERPQKKTGNSAKAKSDASKKERMNNSTNNSMESYSHDTFFVFINLSDQQFNIPLSNQEALAAVYTPAGLIGSVVQPADGMLFSHPVVPGDCKKIGHDNYVARIKYKKHYEATLVCLPKFQFLLFPCSDFIRFLCYRVLVFCDLVFTFVNILEQCSAY